MNRLTIALWIVCLAINRNGVRADEGIALTDASQLHFATTVQAADVLAGPDRFLGALSRFDCQARLKTDTMVTGQDVGAFAARQVLAWTDEERGTVSAAIAAIRVRMEPFDLPFPDSILLIKTTGQEEGNAAYCRGNAIVLPARMTKRPPTSLQRLLIHELFHVLSSHNPELRGKLYSLVGFTTCRPIAMPPSLRDRKLTNPDAPQLDAFIQLDIDGANVAAVPILFASAPAYDVERGGSFFDYLTFRLMAIEKSADGWQPALAGGEPRLLDPKSTPSFHSQIGGNTAYIIHPDEILADNFVHLINQTKKLTTPDLVARLRRQLAR